MRACRFYCRLPVLQYHRRRCSVVYLRLVHHRRLLRIVSVTGLVRPCHYESVRATTVGSDSCGIKLVV